VSYVQNLALELGMITQSTFDKTQEKFAIVTQLFDAQYSNVLKFVDLTTDGEHDADDYDWIEVKFY
jgi:methyltransferase-like protein